MDYQLPSELVKTEFNSALASLERLHQALKFAMVCSVNLDFPSWKLALDLVYREISVKLTIKEKEALGKYKNIVEQEYIRIVIESVKYRKPIYAINNYLPLMLPKYEEELRKYADDHGLLIPDKGSVFDN